MCAFSILCFLFDISTKEVNVFSCVCAHLHAFYIMYCTVPMYVYIIIIYILYSTHTYVAMYVCMYSA